MQEFVPYTNAAVMQAAFQQQLPGFAQSPWVLQECRVLHSRLKMYLKPASRRKSFLSVTYQVAAVHRLTGEQHEQILYARAYLDGRSRAAFAQARAARLCPVRLGPALTHVAALDMVVWGFPNDPAMPHLPEVVVADRVRQHLPYHRLGAGPRHAEDITDLSVKVMNYRAEERCTACYEVHYLTAEQPKALMLYGKTFADDSGQCIGQRMARVWENAQHEPEAFLTPRPLAYAAPIRTLWQEALPGVPLLQAIQAENASALLTAVGHGLAALQRSDVPCSVRLTPAALVAEVQKKAAKLAQALPHLHQPLQRTVRRLVAQMPCLEAGVIRLIHGDFHLQQMTRYGDRIALFDFDEFALGDPLQDVANFLADLHAFGFAPALRQRLTAALLDGYQARAEWAVPSDRLHWHLGVQCLTKAYRSWWQHKPHIDNVVRAYLALAQQGMHAETPAVCTAEEPV